MLTEEQDPQTIRRMFARIASRYDFLNHLLSLNFDRVWRRRLARQVIGAPGGRYLDVCCGTGDQALALLRAGAASVVGCDFTQPMLQVAAAKLSLGASSAPARGEKEALGRWGPVQIVCADALALPFGDGTFEGATVSFGIRNVSDRMAGLREMARVVRPGGRVGVLEFYRPAHWALRAVYLPYLRWILPGLGSLLSKDRAGAYRYLPRSVMAFPSATEFAGWMALAGLRRVEVYRMCGGIVCATVGVRK